jgi:hypothetical protein
MSTLSTSSEYSNCKCILEQLSEKPFSTFNHAEKIDIIQRGKPRPSLPNLKTETKKCVRYFQDKFYDNVSWLCGCGKTGKLYCWPCFLFSNDVNIWTKHGFSDLNNFHNLQKRHELTTKHISSCIALKNFGKSRIDFQLNEGFKINVEKHNERVKENRFVISGLIDVVLYLSKQELAFRGHDESAQSSNKGNYVELINLMRKRDSKFDALLDKSSTVFTGVSNDVQNDLIESIGQHLIDKIKKEIMDAPFVSIIMDETTDVSNKSQLSTVLRYASPNGEVQERFLGFADCTINKSANSLATRVFEILEKFECKNKLVAQTYDGAAVMSGEKGGVQALVKAQCNQAIFVHCYAHKLSLVLKQSVEFIKECKIFFSSLSGFSSFFSKSTKRTRALDDEVKRRFPKVSTTRWNYNSRLHVMIEDNRLEIISLMESIVDEPHKWDAETRSCAEGFLSMMYDFKFNFLLKTFSPIFTESDTLFDILQKKSFDIGYCQEKIKTFHTNLNQLRNNFDFTWANAERVFENLENSDAENEGSSRWFIF